MLLIFHCKTIYGTELPYLVPALREQGHRIAVCGDIQEHDTGYLDNAFLVLSADDREMCMADRNPRSTQAMLRLLMSRSEAEPRDTLLLSDAPNELEAARSLGIPTISPFVFGRLFQTEGTVERVMRYRE